MAFNVTYSFNNDAVTGTATSITALRQAINNYGLNNLTQCTLAGTAEGNLYDYNLESGLFSNCNKLTSLDLSNLDTSNVTNMREMFYNCSSLTSLNLSNFDTSNVTNMSSMFESCNSLTSIKVDILLWNTSKVTSSSNMFNGCTHLPNYNSSYIDITKAINKSLGGYLDVVVKPIAYYKYYEHYSDGVRVIPKAKDMFEFITQDIYDAIIPDPDMLYFIIEE